MVMEEEMDKLTVYMRLEQQKQLSRRKVCVNDVSSIFCTSDRVEGEIKGLIIETIRGKKTVIKAVDIIRQITQNYNNVDVVLFGEPEVLVEYEDGEKNKILEAIKVIAVGILIFFGSAFTIMAFNNDISITGVFEHFYKQMTGIDKPKISGLEIFYSIGLALGIIIFFNHIGKRKLSDDVTPIQVEMNKHNKDTYETIIDKVKEKCDD